jgi:hypothetical protein
MYTIRGEQAVDETQKGKTCPYYLVDAELKITERCAKELTWDRLITLRRESLIHSHYSIVVQSQDGEESEREQAVDTCRWVGILCETCGVYYGCMLGRRRMSAVKDSRIGHGHGAIGGLTRIRSMPSSSQSTVYYRAGVGDDDTRTIQKCAPVGVNLMPKDFQT